MAFFIFSWASKTFRVSDKEILTYNGLSASHSYNTEEKKNGKKMPKTKDVGPGIGTLNFSIYLSALQGNDVKAEHDWWIEKCEEGEYSYILMGAEKFGRYKWRIKQVDVNDLITINEGTLWKSCKLSISFEEYYIKVKKTKAQRKAEKLQKKIEKSMEKALNANNEKAIAKAEKQAEKARAQYEANKQKVAEEVAKQAQLIALAYEKVGPHVEAVQNS